MTKNELADRLNHLDPGATLTVKEGELAILFGDGRLTKEVIAVGGVCARPPLHLLRRARHQNADLRDGR